MVRESDALHSTVAAESYLAQARRYRVERPDRASRWASYAWIAAEGLAGPDGQGLRALAAAEDANARRLLGDWPAAESKIRLAHSQLRPGMDAQRLEVSLLEASLAIDREQWVRAWDRLQWSTDMARQRGDPEALYRAMSKRGIACTTVGRYSEAMTLFCTARQVAGHRYDLRLEALHNLLGVYAAAGWPRDGLRFLEVIEPLYADAPAILVGRRWWLEGRLLCQAGQPLDGAARLRDARQVIAEHHRYAELAEVVCDEAEAWLQAGEPGETMELARVAEKAFAAVGLARQASRAAGLLRCAGVMAGGLAISAVRTLLRARRTAPMRDGS